MFATKVMYLMKYGFAVHAKNDLNSDIDGRPFTFHFDELTNQQIKKQYDGCVTFNWTIEKNILTAYCGTLFIGHCSSPDLLNHFNKFFEENHLSVKVLLNLGMDGPNVNLAFKNLLIDNLKEDHKTTFIYLGTCSLDTVSNAFGNWWKNWVKSLISIRWPQTFISFSSTQPVDEKISRMFQTWLVYWHSILKNTAPHDGSASTKSLLNALNSYRIWWNTFWKRYLNYLDSMINTKFPRRQGKHASKPTLPIQKCWYWCTLLLPWLKTSRNFWNRSKSRWYICFIPNAWSWYRIFWLGSWSQKLCSSQIETKHETNMWSYLWLEFQIRRW